MEIGLNPCQVRLNIEMNIPAGGSMGQMGVGERGQSGGRGARGGQNGAEDRGEGMQGQGEGDTWGARVGVGWVHSSRVRRWGHRMGAGAGAGDS